MYPRDLIWMSRFFWVRFIAIILTLPSHILHHTLELQISRFFLHSSIWCDIYTHTYIVALWSDRLLFLELACSDMRVCKTKRRCLGWAFPFSCILLDLPFNVYSLNLFSVGDMVLQSLISLWLLARCLCWNNNVLVTCSLL